MESRYGIQHFHDAGFWQTLGEYQGFPDAASAMRAADQLGSGRTGRFTFPLGLRVTGPGNWKSHVFGGRANIRVLNDPVTDQWVGGCRNCPTAINAYSPYVVTEFARRHRCGAAEDESLAPQHAGRLIKMRKTGPRGH
jgi:hypothetical protein